MLLWLIETEVFKMPQLHKHINVLCSKKHPLLEELDIALEDFNPNNKFAEPEIEYGMEDDGLSEGGFDEENKFLNNHHQ